jgi:general stress protein 26
MVTDSNFRFICDKIQELRTAVMYSMSNELVRLPNDIVTYVNIDEEGQLWFLSHLPPQLVSECEREFPARLHFFRKGYDYFIEVSGKAEIVSDISSDSENQENNAVLIKMTMRNVEYREPHARREKTKMQLALEKSYKWMLKNIGFSHSGESVLSKLHQTH